MGKENSAARGGGDYSRPCKTYTPVVFVKLGTGCGIIFKTNVLARTNKG